MASATRDRGFLSALRAGLLEARTSRSAAGTGTGGVPPPTPAAGRRTMLPSSGGRITEILFAIPAPVLNDDDTDLVRVRLEQGYISIFSALPDDCRIVVLVKAGSEEQARVWLRSAGVDVHRQQVVIMSQSNATMWANDPFWTCRLLDAPGDKPVLVEPIVFPRFGDCGVADDLINGLQYQGERLARRFEGGNILAGDDFYLIGADSVVDLCCEHAVRSALQDLESVRSPIIVGGRDALEPPPTCWTETINGENWSSFAPEFKIGSCQPIFHIDMYVTLVGRVRPHDRFTVLVGDPGRASELMGRRPWAEDLERDPSLQAAFDATAAQLAAAGFDVLRNPLPFVYEDDCANRSRHYYYATYNNAIVQRDPNRVLLPSYADDAWPELECVDAFHVGLWEGLGFEVRKLAEMNAFASCAGAAHCLKNVLRRG